MNKDSANSWKNNLLDVVFNALAESDVLIEYIVFKGARVLSKRLNSYSRQSLDIDANMLKEFVDSYESYAKLQEVLEREISHAIYKYFEKQDPVVYELDRLKITKKPHKEHKLGWNAFEVAISIKDLTKPSPRGLPNLKIDIAAPEDLGEDSISPLNVGSCTVKAYSLERMAGEKLRAFLSSLPTYRAKVKKPGKAIRAKDIYDICRILDQYPISEKKFWDKVGVEFTRACKSRFIDCQGIASFEEEINVTEETYNSDSTIPKDRTFAETMAALELIVDYLSHKQVIPFDFPLPENT